jgi:hypothetical protein
MVKIELNLKSESGAILDKDELVKCFLREMFDYQGLTPEGFATCDEIIEAAEYYGYYQLAIEMRKDIESEHPYKVLQCYGKNEIEGDRLMDAAKLEEVENDGN